MYDYNTENRRWEIEELILGMADIVYENRKLRCELEKAKEYEKKYDDLLNESVENAGKQTACLLDAILSGAFTINK